MGVKVTARLLFREPGQSRGTGRRFIALLLVLSLYLQSVAFVPLQARVKTAAPARPGAGRSATPSTPATQTGETVTIFGPRRFTRTALVGRFTEQFTLPAGIVAPFSVQIENGDLDGQGRVLAANVRLNGTALVTPGELNAGVPSLTKPAQLTASNTLEVSFFGRFASHLTITVTGTRETSGSTTPNITDFNPKQGPPGTLVTLSGTSLKVNSNDPAVTFTGSNNARQPAQVVSSTPAEVRVTVPNGAQTGLIELTNANGLARTATAFTVQASQDFQLNAAPATVSAIQRSTATQLLTLTSPQPDFSQLARLLVTGLPTGVKAAFEPEQITAGASSTLTLNLADVNLNPGAYPFTLRATAKIDGQDVERTATATLNVVAAGQTSLTGLVLSNEQEPIVAATVSLDGRSATTDAAGVFLLIGVTAGQNRPVMIDGRTASAPNKTYPVITEPANIVAGQVNTVPFTFYLPALDTQFEKDLIPNQTNVVGNPRLPDLAMTIPAGANLRNLDGTPVTRVSISPVEPDRVPAPLPSNLATNMVYTSQPGGAVTMNNVMMPVTYPNLAGADPNTRIELYYFDHDAVIWRRYGFGRVSTDGLRIVPETNPATGQPYGLPDFSWHFPNIATDGNPGPNDDCPKGGGGSGGCPDPQSCPRSEETVDFTTGVKIENTTDISFGGARGALELTRTYTTDLGVSCTNCPFGRGTTHNYDIKLTGTFAQGGTGRVKMGEQVTGRLFSFNPTRSSLRGLTVFTSRSTTSQLADEVLRLGNGSLVYRRRDGSSMTFNSAGLLTSKTDTNNNTVTLAYSGNNLTSVTDAVGRSLNFTYDSGGRITRVTDPLGRNWDYTYTNGILTQVKDPLQGVTSYSYSNTGPARLASITDTRGNTVKQLTYDSAGRVIEQKFADRGVERYAYTLSGNTITGVAITDALNRVETKRFNVAGYVIEHTDALGQKVRIERDMNNNLVAAKAGPCGCTENQYEYDERGNVTKSTDRLGGVTRMEYAPVFNKVTKITDELGRITSFAYDSRGNMISRTDALGRTTSYVYDGFGQLTSMSDPLGHTRTMEYDAQGNLSAVKDALGNRSTFEYDNIGRLTAVIDPLGRRAAFAYDALDRVTTLTDASGATTKLDYDPNGNLTSFINALDQRWTSAYDNKNHLVTTTDPQGRVARWVYDREDQLVARVSPSGRTTRYAYDARGLLESTTTPLGFVTRYAYDNSKNLSTLTDARGNVTTFTYDELYRLNGQRDPLGHLTRYAYDAADNVTERTDRLGRRTGYTYDALNRPTQIQYVDATVSYQYDLAYRLTRIDDTQSGSIQWAYDDADRLLSETTPQGVVSYTYNTASQRASMKAADRPLVNYTYDTAGRLATIAQGNETFTYAYDTLSRVASLQRPNGVRTAYAYDNVYRLARLTHTNSANLALEDFQYAYNADDEIESIASLASAQLLPTAKTAAPADAANRLPQFGTTSYTHDNEGQTLTRTDTPTVSNYTWDARGRLTDASLSNGQNIDYGYDALGRRNSRTVGSTTTSFLYDGDDVVLDLHAGGATVDYLNGPNIDDKLRQTTQTASALYFLQNHLHSTLALTDSGGGLVERSNYEGFGASGGSGLTRFTYTGREADPLSGLMYNRARWYDPQQGRFLSEDPIGMLGGLNLYGYTANNPINFSDPFGLEVYVGEHPAFFNVGINPLNHAAIVLRPDNPEDFKNHPLFKDTGGKEATLGGQLKDGKLVSAPNYSGDNPNNLNDLTKVPCPEGQTDTEFIQNLINAANAYKNDKGYAALPVSGPLGGDVYNSNSYVSGVLKAAGATPPNFGGFKPGYNKPLPLR
jgi:RHS repeat-associated protein